MKRFFSVFLLVLLWAACALATPSDARLILVRATHQRVHRHRAHKAGKHHRARRGAHHRTV
jgi:hypothetical protein